MSVDWREDSMERAEREYFPWEVTVNIEQERTKRMEEIHELRKDLSASLNYRFRGHNLFEVMVTDNQTLRVDKYSLVNEAALWISRHYYTKMEAIAIICDNGHGFMKRGEVASLWDD